VQQVDVGFDMCDIITRDVYSIKNTQEVMLVQSNKWITFNVVMTCDVIVVTYGALLIDHTCYINWHYGHCYHCAREGVLSYLTTPSVTKTIECGCKVWRVWRRIIGGLMMAGEKFKYSKTFPIVLSWTLCPLLHKIFEVKLCTVMNQIT
jgi:hypothetical protein